MKYSLFSLLVSLRSLRLVNQLMCIIMKIILSQDSPFDLFSIDFFAKTFFKNWSCQIQGVAYLKAVAYLPVFMVIIVQYYSTSGKK